MSSQGWFKHEILFLRCLDKLFLERGREREKATDVTQKSLKLLLQ